MWHPSPGSRQTGQATLEFALVAPIMLMILLAMFAFGHVLLTHMIAVSAAERGGRLGAVLYGDHEVSTTDAHQRTYEATMTALSVMGNTNRAVDVHVDGDDIHVRVHVGGDSFLPFLQPVVGDSMDVDYEAIYLIERDTP